MANPGYSQDDPRVKEAADLVAQYGDVSSAARAAGIPDATLRRRYKQSRQDPGVSAAMRAVNTNLVPKSAWLKTKPDGEGNSYSVQLVPKQDAITLDDIRAAFDGVKPSKPVAAPRQVLDDLCAVYPLFDAHVGLLAWGRETGDQDYDLDHAANDMRMALAKVLAITPKAKQGVLIIGGDYLHADDDTAQTPQSKHNLDVDGRQFKVLEVGVSILIDVVERLLSHHQEVLIRVMRGNHDPHAHMVITFALAERYRAEPRVTVEKDPRDLFMFQWGRSAILAHHGDKRKPQDMVMLAANACPFWSDTKHRHFLTGHIHHDSAKDFPGIRWESVRAFCPPDAYGALFGGKRTLQAMTFHLSDGLVLRAMDPIER